MTSPTESVFPFDPEREPPAEHEAALVRSILLGELTPEQVRLREGLSEAELTEWMRRHRRAVRRAIEEQIATALETQGLEKEDFVLSGNLESLSLSDLLETIQLGRKNAHLRIEHRGEQGQLWCVEGDVIDAEAGPLVGSLAVYWMLALTEGRLQAEFCSVARPRTILASTEELLVEAARRVDELNLLRAQLGDTTRVCVASAAEPGAAELEPKQRELLRTFDGTRSIDDVTAASALPELETLQRVAQLLAAGRLVAAPPPPLPGSEVRVPRAPKETVHRAAQPGYASQAPTSSSRLSDLSVPAVAPSLAAIADRVAPWLARRPTWVAIAGGCLGLAFALGLWSAGSERPSPARAPAAPQPALLGLTTALCGPGMELFAPGASERSGGSAAADPALRPFCLAQRSVSSQEYQACVDSGRCEPAQTESPRAPEEASERNAAICNAGQPGREQLPINCVTQRQADRYCEQQGQRLPLPAEWEWAWQLNHGRATVTPASADAPAKPAEPASIGNLSEWTKELPTHAKRGAPPSPEPALYAVLRVAGVLGESPSESQPNRLYMSASAHARSVGFRCALSLEASRGPADHALAEAAGDSAPSEPTGSSDVVAPSPSPQ